MNSTNTLPTLPDAFWLLHVLETDKLGVQLFVGCQSVADRLVKKFELVDWREYV